MDAKQAKEETLKRLNEIETNTFAMRETLKEINNAIKDGRFKCNIFDDDKLRESLKLLGYQVSDMWREERWYKTEYMTVSWE
jgi:hypothetical protein